MKLLLELLRSLEEYSSRTCIAGQDFEFSYGDLVDKIQYWTSRFDAWPVPAGCVVALAADYSLSAIAAFLALLRLGATPALIPGDGGSADYLKHCLASGLVTIDAAGEATYVALTPTPDSHCLLDRARQTGAACFIVFTSGSTGTPKAALHSAERFLLKFQKPGRSLRTLAFLLFDHIAGLDTLFYTLRNGGTLVLTDRRDPHTILRIISVQKVEVLPTSPSFLRLLCAATGTQSMDLSSLRIITYGSEPMDDRTLRRVNEQFPNVRIIQKYGTTELGSPKTISRSNDSLWLKFKDDRVEFKVIDGVLWLRTQGTMLGYLNVPSPVAHDGWYCTGDLVEVAGEWMRFLGRADDVVKVGGEKVYPYRVESAIRELPFVIEALVSAEPHALMGHVLLAHVSVAPEKIGISRAATEIRQHCRERFGAHHAPVRVTVVLGNPVAALGYRQKLIRQNSGSRGENA